MPPLVFSEMVEPVTKMLVLRADKPDFCDVRMRLSWISALLPSNTIPHSLSWKMLLRSVAGLLIFVGLYALIMWIEPDEARQLLYSLWRFGGFFILSFFAIFLFPLIFRRML